MSIATEGGIVHAKETNLNDVLGKLIFWSAGSTSGSAYLSAGVVTKSRNTVELHLIPLDVFWSSTDVTPFDESGELIKDPNVKTVMINCRDKRYSTYPDLEAQNTYSHNQYLSGRKYAWGDYKNQELLMNVGQEEEDKMTELFDQACTYTAR
ncbi:hypothetical protein [Bordetella sp. 02P26C-1]|uniref:hypothetical protein n=1 Tax=Bordetella sp. 02P26C-1 TaxID=2683195 RepID=UPI0013541722|nr:hypothetical protein [Bordetella sp. 02P26C-1]MVW80118.1 hypothetical protein [Bordetella sp. 02P26C-1]